MDMIDNMDKPLEKKRGLRKKHIPYIALGAVVAGFAGWAIFGNHTSRMNVDASWVTVSPVTRGEFNDYIRLSGRVAPIRTVQLSAIEGGIVDEIVIEEGSMVKKGDVILRLSNPGLNLGILDSEAQLAEKQNFLRNTQVTMEQERLSLAREKLQLETDVIQKKRKYEQYNRLVGEKLVSREEYMLAKEDYDLALDGLRMVMERQKQDSIYRGIQVDQMEESLENMRENMFYVRQRRDNLNVRATVDGQLGLIEAEIGQSIAAGMRIGQINVLTDYKIEAMIDEHYIDRVRADLEATFERQDRTFALRARKVFPEVREKQFKTEFVFEGERPDNIRAGQTYYINLQLGQPTDAVLIPRGTFYHTTGGRWIFVLTPDGTRAVRRPISIGRQNPAYYEVTDGLQPGEKVITSGYETFGDTKELILK